MMKSFRICLLPALLLATLTFYSCKKDTAKEPERPVTVDSNAVDNGVWNLDERMDDWYTLFDVKEGDKLYLAPENRVRIW